MKKTKKIFPYLLLPTSIFALVTLVSCSSHQKPIIEEPTNEEFPLWSNEEAKNNLFSQIEANNKFKIIQNRGANDIENPEFNGNHKNENPLHGKIINKQYQQLAKISYSVNFSIGGAPYLGTAWLLDYEIPNNTKINDNGNSFNDDNYPTKWYLATNTHVMDDLKTKNSIYQETNTKNWNNKSTSRVSFKRIKNPQLNQDYSGSSYNNPNYDVFDISMLDNLGNEANDPAIKPIFIGFDYLFSSPDDFINNVPQPIEIPDDVTYFKKIEEMADFSVFEIDFEKIPQGSFPTEVKNSPHLFAKLFTNNYANWAYKDQFKPATNSLLKTSITELTSKKFYALGFPQEFALGGSNSTANVGLWINQPKNLIPEKYEDAGANLVLERHYNSFKNVPGIFDSIIGSPDFGYKFQPISKVNASGGIIPYIYQGLLYVENNGDMMGGSSGSIFVDENNYIYGIHFASDFTTHVGINFALKCEGYNYQGKYGNYNLQPYDLIYGGYKNQKSSYREQLLQIYGSEFRTNIFRNSVENK